MNERLRTGGEGMQRSGLKLLDFTEGLRAGIAAVGLAVIMLAADLALGPFFLYAQASNQSVSLDGFGVAIPWIVSLATTGLLYALWQRSRTKRMRNVVLLASFVSVIDTLVDIGGFNSLLLDDPQAGLNIFLPPGQPWYYWFANALVAGVCLANEPCLETVLGRFQFKADEGYDFTPGSKVEAGLVWFGGWLFNFVKLHSMIVGAFAMSVLDAILTPQIAPDFRGKALLFAVSLVASFWLISVWRLYEHLRENNLSFKDLDSRQQVTLLGGAVVVVGDTWFDLSGYNETYYGTSSLIIDNPTIAWGLSFATLAVMCTCSEMFASQLFRGLHRYYEDDGEAVAVEDEAPPPAVEFNDGDYSL